MISSEKRDYVSSAREFDAGSLLGLLNQLESELPVTEWAFCGRRIWPRVRSRIWQAARSELQGRPGASNTRHRSGVLRFVRAHAGALAGKLRDREHSAALRQRADIVFFGSDVSRVLLGRTWYDRLLEPAIEAAEELNASWLHFETGTRYRTPRSRESVWIEPILDRSRVRARTRTSSSSLVVPSHEEVLDRLADARIPVQAIDKPALLTDARAFDALTSTLLRLLQRTRPQLAVLYGYGLVEMAFNQACAELGICSAELQHGVQGSLHPMYAQWKNVPATGYESLPCRYLVWSGEDAATISGWSAHTAPRHSPIVVGNPWVAKWRSQVNDDDALVEQVKEALPATATFKRTVLLTLQRDLGATRELSIFLRAISATPDWWWAVRLHPGMTDDEELDIRQALEPFPNVHLHSAAEIPLFALFAHVDVHVTLSSTVVIEAAAFGVPSVVCDPSSELRFQGVIAAGWARCAEDFDHLVRAVEQLAASSDGLASFDGVEGSALEEVLASMLKVS